jgi:hypothetical protein
MVFVIFKHLLRVKIVCDSIDLKMVGGKLSEV